MFNLTQIRKAIIVAASVLALAGPSWAAAGTVKDGKKAVDAAFKEAHAQIVEKATVAKGIADANLPEPDRSTAKAHIDQLAQGQFLKLKIERATAKTAMETAADEPARCAVLAAFISAANSLLTQQDLQNITFIVATPPWRVTPPDPKVRVTNFDEASSMVTFNLQFDILTTPNTPGSGPTSSGATKTIVFFGKGGKVLGSVTKPIPNSSATPDPVDPNKTTYNDTQTVEAPAGTTAIRVVVDVITSGTSGGLPPMPIDVVTPSKLSNKSNIK